jgi:CyaY protein
MPDVSTPSGFPDADYDAAARRALARIEAQVDAWLDGDVIDIDAARTGGMITLSLPNRSQLIVNMQPPLHELWLAARQGGFHFRYAGGDQWPDTRTGEDFFAVLSACATAQAGQTLSF